MLKEQISESLNFLKKKGIVEAEVGIILGTGLGSMAEDIDLICSLSYREIPHFPLSTVETHEGKLVYGMLAGKKVLAMQGRFHYYEGYSMKEITFPLYVMKSLGIKNLLISNAAGNLNLNWKKGELMIVGDHIDLLPENPLRGVNDPYFGPRWPDMSRPYSSDLVEKIESIAVKQGITIRKGVYVAVQGPNLETASEYRRLKLIGADAVGMSTVPEVIVSNYLNIPVCVVSVLTDDCDPDNLFPADIAEIIALAGQAERVLSKLFFELIEIV